MNFFIAIFRNIIDTSIEKDRSITARFLLRIDSILIFPSLLHLFLLFISYKMQI